MKISKAKLLGANLKRCVNIESSEKITFVEFA